MFTRSGFESLRFIIAASLIFFLSLIVSGPVLGQGDEEIELVFFNPDTTSKNPIDATNALQTFANVVNQKLNINIRAYYFKKQKDLERFLSEKKVEFGVLSQMFLVENADKYNLVPFACPIRNGKKTYRKVIVVRKDKPFNDLEDLRGKILAATALGEENIAFYNKVVFRGEIEVSKHFSQIMTVDSVHSAILAVLYGQADAAAVALTSFNIAQELNPQAQKNLKSIYTSEETPISPMSYFKDNVDPELLPRLKKILLETHLDPVGRQSCLAFNVEAWVDTSWDDYRRTQEIVKQANMKGPAPHSTTAVAAATTTSTSTVKTPDVPPTPVAAVSISRVQLYKGDGSNVVCNAWVKEENKKVNPDSMKLVYQVNNGEKQEKMLTGGSDGKFTAEFVLKELEATSSDSKEITYAVQSGDTLGKIAQKYLGSSTKYMLIVAYNNIKDPNIIYVGQKLRIKEGDVTVVEVAYNVEAKDEDGKTISSKSRKVIL